MPKVLSCVRDSKYCMLKIKDLKDIPKDALFFTADTGGLYRSVSHKAGLRALRKNLDCKSNKSIYTNDLFKTAEFVLKKNYSEYNGKVKQNI